MITTNESPTMPPLLKEELTPFDINSIMIGTSCENIIKSYLLSVGLNVAEPHVDFGVDILVKMETGWKKAQVKKVIKKNRKGFIRFNFPFQPIGSCRVHPENGGYRGTRVGPNDLDYFYYVLLTPLRQLIWEVPSYEIGLRDDGTFRTSSEITLDKVSNSRKAAMNFKSFLLDAKYNIKVFEEHPDFFIPQTLDDFIMEKT